MENRARDKLSYGQTAKVTLDGLAGTGTAELSSYECQLIIPKGTEIEQIDLEEFEHASKYSILLMGKNIRKESLGNDSNGQMWWVSIKQRIELKKAVHKLYI